MSGSGKSTLLRLLLRFYDAQGGSVKVGGRDIRDWSLASLRGALGVVPQDVVLFNESVSHNIRYGKLEADQDEVEEAAQKANIHQQVLSLPRGYSTIVGERGMKLSGGEKQRIALARAFLREPRVR